MLYNVSLIGIARPYLAGLLDLCSQKLADALAFGLLS